MKQDLKLILQKTIESEPKLENQDQYSNKTT